MKIRLSIEENLVVKTKKLIKKEKNIEGFLSLSKAVEYVLKERLENVEV